MKTYPAKLLLFGEHTVNAGSQALAIPLPLYFGSWKYAPGLPSVDLAKKQQQLPHFASYITDLQKKGSLLCQFDVMAFEKALTNGLYFESNIPKGYGVGSSGALVAAVLDEFGNEENPDLLALKKGLAQMEGFFHGTSSGTDPLVCYLKKPLLLSKHGVELTEVPVDITRQLFLLDTGIERQATPLIEYFLEKMKAGDFAVRCAAELLPAVDEAIGAYLRNDTEQLFEKIHRIGSFQMGFLEKMIPQAYRQLWKVGLEGDSFKLKVCGAGGGGFLLGITKNFEELTNRYPWYKIIPVPWPTFD